jgi:WD40-like Beta Propeller Repeat
MRMRRSRIFLLLLSTFMCVFLIEGVPLSAQTAFVPYFGKNNPRYNKFPWKIYKTDHFEIFYYPDIEKHLERVASFAESAYQHVSAELKHDLASKVPLILFKTESEFQQQHVGEELPEGVLAFAEPERNRMVLPIDMASDQLYELITHELTHIFEFDIIPRGLVNSSLPLWMDEGLSDYMAGAWNTIDLMQVRDAAITDSVPKMSEMNSQPLSGRIPYSLGHATFEFIESKWGKDGLRQFLFSLRKSVIGGGDSAYEEALKLKPEDFDDQFDRYLKERFKPFRDKERPADYGRNLAPRPGKTPFVSVLSIEPSPTGDIIAAVVGNERDQELDIILISTKDGQVIRNLTKGFDKDRGFEYIATAGGLRGNMVPWITWAPVGDHIAYFARTERDKTLIIQNVVTGKTDRRIPLPMIDGPESPAFSPDGKKVVFSGLQGAVGDLFAVDIESGQVTNLTKDAVADYSPTFSPDGKSIVYSVHLSGNDKLFLLDLADGQKKQITFGTHDDTGAKFLDDHTIVFTSTATDPNVTITPEVARNGNIPNIWTLDLAKSELKQWTDTVTGNLSPAVLRQSGVPKIAFVSYYKGENGIHFIEASKPIATVASADFGAPGPIIDFQPPLSHTLLRDNIHKKGAFERMTMAGRPPVNLGVTSGGTFYGNTQLQFADILGDKQISFFAQTVSTFRTTALSYLNIEHRLQYALQGFSQEQFYYGTQVQQAVLYNPSLAPYITRDLAEAVQSQRGGTAFAIYPFNRYSRVELFGGYIHLNESYTNPSLQELANQYQQQAAANGTPIFRNGGLIPLGIAFVHETTIFREFGPVAGRTLRLSYDASPKIKNTLSRQTVALDLRHYTRLAANGVLALRFKGQKSYGSAPDFMYFGGNSELRGYDYLQFLGHKAFFANAELRFPLIEAMLTPFGVLGGLRGVFFAGIGGAGFNGYTFTPWTRSPESYTPLLGYQTDFVGNAVPVYGTPQAITGFRLKDSQASYGIGLESSLLGLPMHFDWSYKTLLNKTWEDNLFAANGGSAAFRKVKFSFWIGYDF